MGLSQLCRPLNVIVTGAVVVVGGVMASRQAGIVMSDAIYGAALSAALIAAAGNVINDVYDVAIDRINRPARPLPSGRVSIVHAGVWGAILFMAGIIVAFSISPSLGWIAVIVSILLWSYSHKLKKMPFIGNVVVSVCGGLAFIYGAVAVSELKYGIYPAVFAGLIHLSREIIKDIEDMPGDRAVLAKTLPLMIGEPAALRTAAVPLVLLTGLTIIPYLLDLFGVMYLTLVIVTVDIPLLMLVYFTTMKPGAIKLRALSQALKVLMVTGLAALYFG